MPNPNREHLPLPADLTPDEFISFCITLPHDSEHLAAFWGAVQALAQRYTWGKPLTEDSETIARYWLNLINDNRECYEEAIMASGGCGGCCDDPIYRYNADGVREVSRDGGETWTTDTGDPRVSGTILPPPLWLDPEGGNECEGAASARASIETALNQIFNTGVDVGLPALIGLVQAILCAFLGPAGCAISSIVTSIALALIEVGAEILEDAMTDDVYDDFQCILFCNIAGDATFSEAAWQQVKSDIVDQFSGDPRFVLWNVVNAIGAVGLTNAARMAIAGTGDCDDCDCTEGCTPFLLVGENLTDIGDGYWTAESVDGTAAGYPGEQIVEIVWSDPFDCAIACNLGANEVIEGTTPNANTTNAEGCPGETFGGYPIPPGCYAYAVWRQTGGASFKIKFFPGESC